MMELEQGRPQTTDGRSERELRVYDLLDSLGIVYERIDHPEAATMEACEQIDRLLRTPMCKNLFLCNRQQTSFYLLLMPGDKPFKTKELSAQIGSARLSFANAEHMEEMLGLSPGSVSVMGLMNDREQRVQLLIDQELLTNAEICCHPCVNTSTLQIKTEDVLSHFLQAVKHPYQTVCLQREEAPK